MSLHTHRPQCLASNSQQACSVYARRRPFRPLTCKALPLKGRARSNTVAETAPLKLRTPELACSNNHLSFGIYARASVWTEPETTDLYQIKTIAGQELARARGLGRACALASVGGAV
eukprot:881043-Pleurochrysis_carterae.AAC.1